MKTINLKNAKIKEILINPETGDISVLYNIMDSENNVVVSKRESLKKDELPQDAVSGITKMLQRLISHVESKEQL